MLTAHEPFRSVGVAIKNCTDMQTHRVASEMADRIILVGNTDNGAKIKETINDLKELITPIVRVKSDRINTGNLMMNYNHKKNIVFIS